MKFLVVGLLWLLIAIAVGFSGALQHVRPPTPQAMIVVLTIALLAASRMSGSFRTWLESLDLRVIVALHLTRFIGFYFLFLYGKGELPYGFAVPAGWGDTVVATLSCVLLAAWNQFASGRRWLLLVWNVFGLTDILFVVFSAAKEALGSPSSMAALLRLPLSLLPTFLVPLIIASHIFVFSRLRVVTTRRAGR